MGMKDSRVNDLLLPLPPNVIPFCALQEIHVRSMYHDVPFMASRSRELCTSFEKLAVLLHVIWNLSQISTRLCSIF